MTINHHLIQLYRRHLEGERYAPKNTVDAYLRDVRQFCQHIDPVPWTAIKIEHVRSFIGARRAQGIGPATLQRQIAALRECAAFLEGEGIGSALPFQSFQTPKVPKRLPRPVATADAVTMVRTAPANDWMGLRNQTVLLLLYGCGLRLSEALGIRVEDAPLDDSRALRVRGKGAKQREVAVLPIIARFCKLYYDACPHALTPGSLFFRGARGGPLPPRLIQLYVEQLRRDQGLPASVTPHALRHAFATDLLNRGVDLRSLQMLLGHESVATTAGYAEVAMDRLLTIYGKAHPRNY